MKVLRILALLLAWALVLGMLVLTSSVMAGAIVAGNLWLLLPLALYGSAFFVLASACKAGAEVERYSKEIREINKLEREMNEQF